MDEKIEIDVPLLQHLIQYNNIDVTCPNNMNQTHCLPMIRLFKVLREYKKILLRLTEPSRTVLYDKQLQYISNDQYHKIFVQTAKSIPKLSSNDLEILVNHIPDCSNFMMMSKK
eukprot:46523_1